MFLTFGVLIRAAVLVLGVVWCREMLGRWRRDLDEFRSTADGSARWVLVLLWGVTALVGVALIDSIWRILRSIGRLV